MTGASAESDGSDCPFCRVDVERLAFVGPKIVGLWEANSNAAGHLILTTKRHATSWTDLGAEETAALIEAIGRGYGLLGERFVGETVNVSWDEGGIGPAGQATHFHLHMVVRRPGAALPRDGRVLTAAALHSGRAAATGSPPTADASTPHTRALITGGEDPLLAHLVPHIDQAHHVDVAVAFILGSGARLLQPHLQALLDRGGRLRLVAGDYLDVTDPDALRQLLDLEGDRQLWMFVTKGRSFHPKSWILSADGRDAVAIVGSSNLSETALRTGVEWNYRVSSGVDAEGWRDVQDSFEELLASPQLEPLDDDWIDGYEKRRRLAPQPAAPDGVPELPAEPPPPPPEPHGVQREALAALTATRAAGYRAGLVVLATGLGKTWLGAFDSAPFGRVLFVAHRDEILNQATDTFRRIRPQSRLGRFSGQRRDMDAEVLFASVQTLGRANHLERFAPDAFDYIVVDEFHHAAATTYRRLIQHFRPKFLLGLTATPERMDGGDLLGLCEENLVYRCDAFEAIDQRLLSPFRYFGVPDAVDYANIPWRNARFDEAALTEALATRARADNALDQLKRRGGQRTLGFCASQAHADFMARHAQEAGYRAVAVHSGEGSAPRTSSLDALQAGELDIVFSVDMFNEGGDIPNIDTVLMLRPTESVVIWLQQFGRGLRRAEGKSHLAVIDYIGNHRTFLTKARALLRAEGGDRSLSIALEQVRTGRFDMPDGCEITYDLEALDLMQRLLRPTGQGDVMAAYFQDFIQRMGRRPTAQEMFHAGFHPQRSGHGSWFAFLRSQSALTAEESQAVERHGPFLDTLASTKMTRSYKMLLLRAMLQAGRMPGAIGVADLADEVASLAMRNPRFRDDLSVDPENLAGLAGLLERNPIAAWTEGADGRFFGYRDRTFATTFSIDPAVAPALSGLVQEIVDWRIAVYLDSPIDEPSQPAVLGEAAEEGSDFVRDLPGAAPWQEYMREDIAALYGLQFSTGSWNQGFIVQDREVFLLVTLNKSGHISQHRYVDQFVDAATFAWQSQGQTRQDSKAGRIISGAEPGHRIHLFVRASKLRPNGKASPFVYCGRVGFVRWEGEKPISVTWALPTPLPEHLRRAFGVEAGA